MKQTEDALLELGRVPHVREVIVFDGRGGAECLREGARSDAGPLGALSRGLEQLARRAKAPLARMTVRSDASRVVLLHLRDGSFLGVHAGAAVDVAMLSLALQSAAEALGEVRLVTSQSGALVSARADAPPHTPARTSESTIEVEVLRDAFVAMVDVARPMLGKHVLSNYLRSERPSGPSPLALNAAGDIHVADGASARLSLEEVASCRTWAQGFARRVSRVISDFRERVLAQLGPSAATLGFEGGGVR